MALAAALGCNTIRTFLHFGSHLAQAGLLKPDGALTPAYHAKHEYAPRQTLFAQGPRRVLVTLGNQRQVGGARPLLIGEFGMSTACDPVHGVAPEVRARIGTAPGTEAEQAKLYEIVLAGAQQGHAAGGLAWCLYDYPIKNPTEAHFGLVRADGSLKPAALVLRQAFARWSKP